MQGWILEFRFPRQTLRNGLYILHILYKKLYSLKSSLIFILFGKLLMREGPFHIVNCVKSFDFKLFLVYILDLLAAPFWHICS